MLYEVKDKRLIADCLEVFAGLATIDGKYNRAARLFGMAEAILQAINAPVAEHNRSYESNVATLHTKLDRGTLEKLWADGQGLTLEQAIEYALSESGTTAVDSAILSKKEAKEKFGGLAAREREATALIAQGKSNREIAEAMIVDAKTVETYVTRILNKLGLDSRVQIAIWAIEKGLARSVQPSDS